MITALVAWKVMALAVSQDTTKAQEAEPPRDFLSAEMPGIAGMPTTLTLQHFVFPMSEPKTSPKHLWKFPFVTAGFVKTTAEGENYSPRFRVFAQSRRVPDPPLMHDDVAQWSTRMLLRLWDYNFARLRIDHSERFRRGVDVYLCFAGDAGGEHLFDVDTFDLDNNGNPKRVNTIYIYQIHKIEAPIQLSRELAHEYGHAILPAIGPYEGPEDWANGEVGERLYLQWLRDDLVAGKLSTDDTVHTDVAALDAYLAKNVHPMLVSMGTKGPNLELLKGKSQESFFEYVALTTYAGQILPPRVFGRSLMLTGSQKAIDYEKSIRDAVAEVPSLEITVPAVLKGKAIFIPLGEKAKLSGAKVLSRSGGWAKVQPSAAKIKVTQPGN